MPAAYLTTPAGATFFESSFYKWEQGLNNTIHRGMTDVVKTRLQVEARKGQTTYKGLTDAFVRICRSTQSSYSDAFINEKL
jgi:hypothetical protein